MTLEHIEQSLEKLRSRLYRTVNKIHMLEKAERRIRRRMELEAPTPKSEPVAVVTPPATPAVALQTLTGVDESLDIKEQPWIKSAARGNLTEADKAAIAGIEAAQAERKAAKTTARIAKLKADKAGDRKKMPLSGKKAFERIMMPELDRL
jgi:hypothetical protein